MGAIHIGPDDALCHQLAGLRGLCALRVDVSALPAGEGKGEAGRGDPTRRAATRERWLWNDEPAQGSSTFLKSAGLVLLLLDLLVCVVRLVVLGIYILPKRKGVIARLKADEYMAGLAIESAWLQALWILHTHFTIQACIRRRQAQARSLASHLDCFCSS